MTRSIDWVIIALLFSVLADVAPAWHGQSAHGLYNGLAGLAMLVSVCVGMGWGPKPKPRITHTRTTTITYGQKT